MRLLAETDVQIYTIGSRKMLAKVDLEHRFLTENLKFLNRILDIPVTFLREF